MSDEFTVPADLMETAMGRVLRLSALVLCLVAVPWGAGCGGEESPPGAPSARQIAPALAGDLAWANVGQEQVDAARRHGVAVAFENGLGMRFVLVLEGRFTMGSPATEAGRDDDEGEHEVELTRPYYVQVTEVTNGEYRRFKRDHDSGGHQGQSLNGDRQPVVRVSWDDAVGFAAWVTRQDGGRTYRLPTEAEWEQACRAGTKTRFSWGDAEGDGPKYANANDPETKKQFGFKWDGWPGDDGHRVTAPVGSYQPNGWGLYDLHGNVWEWCADWYGPYPTERVTDPTGPAESSAPVVDYSWVDKAGTHHYKGPARVLRGGTWNLDPGRVRSAVRVGFVPGMRTTIFGFRLVVPLAP